MTWEEKFAAIGALDGEVGGAALHMRAPGDWYVLARVDIAGDGMLTGITVSGKTPDEAMLEFWNRAVTTLPANRHLCVGEKRYRWAGFMWREVAL